MPRNPDRPTRRRSPRVYSNQRGLVTREELLRALQFTVFEKGWRKTTIRELALRAGVSVGTVHHHFASRDEMARSMYDDACARIDEYVRYLRPAPLEVLFRSLVEVSLHQLGGLGEAYVDALGQSLRARRPLPTLRLVLQRFVKLATDLHPTGGRSIVWLLELTLRALVEWWLVEGNDAMVLASAEEGARALAALSWTNGVVELDQFADAARPPVAQVVGTPWHDQDINRMMTLGLPSQNPRRKRESERRRRS